MSHLEQLSNLLEPLRVYDMTAPFHLGELVAVGEALDEVMAELDEIQREMSLMTAEDWGVERMAELFSVRPVSDTASGLASAFAALLRIGGDSFTLADINDTVKGCGLNALVTELEEPNSVQVKFPDVAGIPVGYQEIKRIIDGILPAQLSIEYIFWYYTWGMLAEMVWSTAEDGYSWYTLATGEK